MSGATEVELKLRLPRLALDALRRHPALRAAVRGRARREELSAVYFDTADLALAAQGLALRVRRERGRWRQALKGRGTHSGGLAQRAEDEWDLGHSARRPSPDVARLAASPLGRAAVRATRGKPIGPVFTTTYVRTALPLRFADGTSAEAAIDVGRVQTSGGTRRASAFCELELELRTGEVARLFELAAALAADLPIAVETRSKAQRGYALARPVAATPRHAQPLDYPRDAATGTVFGAIVRNALAQVEGNAEGVAAAGDPEWIHQMRVGVRRLRSALALARPLAGADDLRAVEDEARWLADVLGRARDLDVFVGETLPPLASATAALRPDPALATLEAGAHRRLARARADVRAALRSPRFQRLQLALGALAAALPLRATDVPARAFAQAALRRRHRQLVRAGEALAGSPEERHAVRIAAKKVRYAVEFFTPLFVDRPCAPYRRALSELQDVLGRLNDCAAAVALAEAVSAPGATAPSLVAGWAAARAAGEARALRRSWKRWREAKPFWKDATEG